MIDLPPEMVSALYVVQPEEFVAARSAAAAEARARGDADTAKSIAALRKPTVAAWMVNLAAHRHPDLVDQLLDVGADLRQAQQSGQAARVRELSQQRDRATTRLVDAIRDLVEQAGRGGKLPEDELRATFFAAVSDPQVGAVVRAGRVEKTVAYSGFGGLVEVPLADEAPAKTGPATVAPQLVAAQDAERDARARYEKAAHEHTDALRTLNEVDEQIAKLAARRTAATHAADRAEERRARAEQALADAAARVKALQ